MTLEGIIFVFRYGLDVLEPCVVCETLNPELDFG